MGDSGSKKAYKIYLSVDQARAVARRKSSLPDSSAITDSPLMDLSISQKPIRRSILICSNLLVALVANAPTRTRRPDFFMKVSVSSAAILLAKFLPVVHASTRVPFGSFGLSFPGDLVCGEKPWVTAEKVRSGAEDCLREFGCRSSALGDPTEPFFIGLGNAECENNQVLLRGGVMQFEEGSEIPTDVETCVRELLTSGECTSIFQEYVPAVDRSPTYISEQGMLYPPANPDEAPGDVLKDAPEPIKSTTLPVVPLAAASAGALLLIGLSTFIVFRKTRVANNGFTNLGSNKSVPVSSTMSTTESDVEMGTALTQSDSLVMKRSPALGEMLDKVFSVSSLNVDDCSGTPDTTHTKISSTLESSTFSEDEDDHGCVVREPKVSLTQHSYDTRSLIEASDNEEDHEGCPVIAIPSFDVDLNSSQAQLLPLTRLAYDNESVILQDSTPRFRSYSNATENVGKRGCLLQDLGPFRSNSLPNIHQRVPADELLLSSDDEISQDDPELVFFNEIVSHPSTHIDDDDDSMLELVTEGSSVVSDGEFEPDLYWNPDDTSVTVFDAASMALNGTGEFSFHANVESPNEQQCEATTRARELADWSSEVSHAMRLSATSLPAVCEHSKQLGGATASNSSKRRKSTSFAPCADAER